MTVGEALAVARTRAGLSVDEVSERTRIREVVIRAIERDDYELCGGDLYVRGYLRVIADAVGLDAQPLIREFEGGSAPVHVRPVSAAPPGAAEQPVSVPPVSAPEPPTSGPAGRSGHLESPAPAPEVILDLTRVAAPEAAARARSPETAARASSPGTAARTGSPGTAAPTTRRPVPAGLRQTSMDLPALGHGHARARRSLPAWRGWENWFREHRRAVAAVAAATAVFVIAVAVGQLFSGGSGASASGSATASAPGLTVPFALAFGPNGTADGDNPSGAMAPVTAGSTQPWSTQQYPTAEFGQQKTGTGLLLDLGSTVTVTSVAVDLGAGSGASLQVGAGNSSVSLSTVASAKNAGSDVVLRPGKPVNARYLLIWFTRLPRASDGLYQASVYHVTVNGRP